MSSSTRPNGRPIEIVRDCSDAMPPPSIRAVATMPASTHQNIRCTTGASILPPAVMMSITSDPESAEVTKKIAIRQTLIPDTMFVNGRPSSILNRASSGTESATPR